MDSAVSVTLRRWSDDDLPLLHATLGNEAMMKHLGGIETPEQIRDRHVRYLNLDGSGAMFTIRFGASATIAGSIGLWERLWHGEKVYETGWLVLPEHGRRGIATEAARAVIAYARSEGRYPSLHAFPSVDNAASNAVCRKAGFSNQGECQFEYPKEHFMLCNDWRIDLVRR